MEFTWLALMFRIPAIIAGLLMGIFASCIFRYSQGGMRGWKYLSISGGALFLWAVTSVFFNIVHMPLLSHIRGFILFMIIAFFIPLSYTALAQGFRVDLPSWINKKNALLSVAVVFLLFLISNMLWSGFFEQPLLNLLSISHPIVGVGAFLGCIPLYWIIRYTHKSAWVFAFVGLLLVGVSVNIGQYYHNCCHPGGELAEEPVCKDHQLDYITAYEAPCVQSIVLTGEYYHIPLTLGVILITISFYQLWRAFRKALA